MDPGTLLSQSLKNNALVVLAVVKVHHTTLSVYLKGDLAKDVEDVSTHRNAWFLTMGLASNKLLCCWQIAATNCLLFWITKKEEPRPAP